MCLFNLKLLINWHVKIYSFPLIRINNDRLVTRRFVNCCPLSWLEHRDGFNFVLCHIPIKKVRFLPQKQLQAALRIVATLLFLVHWKQMQHPNSCFCTIYLHTLQTILLKASLYLKRVFYRKAMINCIDS